MALRGHVKMLFQKCSVKVAVAASSCASLQKIESCTKRWATACDQEHCHCLQPIHLLVSCSFRIASEEMAGLVDLMDGRPPRCWRSHVSFVRDVIFPSHTIAIALPHFRLTKFKEEVRNVGCNRRNALITDIGGFHRMSCALSSAIHLLEDAGVVEVDRIAGLRDTDSMWLVCVTGNRPKRTSPPVGFGDNRPVKGSVLHAEPPGAVRVPPVPDFAQ